MKAILASANPGKAKELNQMFGSVLELTAAPEKLEVVEDGETFHENAFKKAKAYYEKFNSPALSDDSGLVLKAFPKQLAVHSAYFAPDFPDFKDKCQKVLELYKDEDRSAHFVCVLCLYLGPEEIYYFEGRCHGSITEEIRGDSGFGYDPIFLPEGSESTFGEDSEQKKVCGHRAKAAESLRLFLQK